MRFLLVKFVLIQLRTSRPESRFDIYIFGGFSGFDEVVINKVGSNIGFLYRSRGAMCDSCVSYKIVSPDGSTKTVTESENKDLFFALKGGGGNFGVVTQFEVKLAKIPKNVFVSQRVIKATLMTRVRGCM